MKELVLEFFALVAGEFQQADLADYNELSGGQDMVTMNSGLGDTLQTEDINPGSGEEAVTIDNLEEYIDRLVGH